ncbi:hypothetical protein ACFROC_26965 [Nocardia tengchongensis]|uniref:hypothetical protein n=1 Tax=Nocardia tengchongensis TaxID=2055889 RepID=UPI003688429E
MIGIASQIVAPATLVTALLFYFGYRRIYWYFNHFGVSSTVLEFSNRDYFMRAVDGLYVPLGAIGVLGLTLMWGYVALGRPARVAAGSVWLQRLAVVSGLLLVFNGISSLFWRTPLNRGLTVAPVCVIAGVLLLWFATYGRRQRIGGRGPARGPGAGAVAEWALIFLVVGLSLFWAVDNYAAAVGRDRAETFASKLRSLPQVVIYSDKQLDLDPNGTKEIYCPAAGLAYPYRYEGLVLILEAASNYVLVPASWTEKDGTAVVLPRDATTALRLEFAMPGAATIADKC